MHCQDSDAQLCQLVDVTGVTLAGTLADADANVQQACDCLRTVTTADQVCYAYTQMLRVPCGVPSRECHFLGHRSLGPRVVPQRLRHTSMQQVNSSNLACSALWAGHWKPSGALIQVLGVDLLFKHPVWPAAAAT